MILNIASKIKFSFFSLSLLVLILCSCSSDPKDIIGNNTTGTHKIVLEMQGSEEISYTFAFAGGSTSGVARLFNKENDYQGTTYAQSGTLTGKSTEIICSTSDNGVLLALSLSFSSSEAGKQVKYTLKSYIDYKLVDELTKTVDFTESSRIEMVNFSTVSN